MSQTIFFNNRKIKQPGVYSVVKSGIKNPPIVSDFGSVMIVDTGEGAGWGGGSGVNGALTSGKEAVYAFDNLEDAQAFLGGGILWKVAQKLFKPDRQYAGISSLTIIRAATTTSATGTFTATGGGAAGGSFKFKCLHEGIVGNGVETDADVLVKGYCYTVETAPVDSSKWVLKFWKGTWKGDYSVDGIAFDEVDKENTKPILLAQSAEFDNIQTLIDWANLDASFNAYFVLDATSAVTGTGTVDSDDIAAITGNVLAAGGTESYGSSDLTDALEAISDAKFVFLLSDAYGTANFNSTEVVALKQFVFDLDDKMFIYGGGKDDTEFAQSTLSSKAIAIAFNSDAAVVVHSDVYESSQRFGTGFRRWPSLIHASAVLGRLAGLEPQIPLTFKSIGVDGVVHVLKSKDKDVCLDYGILATYYDDDFEALSCLKGINTLQNNDFQINEDGTTYSIQIKRIIIQINNDIRYNAKRKLLGNPYGVNRNTLSPEGIKQWLKGFLQTKEATAEQDNIILSFQDISVRREGDSYFVSYGIVPNGEIDKLFFVGFMID